jgi:hypothetical protein
MTFTSDDLLELKPFCERLEKFLLIEKDYVEGSLVVALTGGFGSGKSCFLDMWRNDLLERRTKGDFCPMPVMLNAWESDHCGDPLLAILAEMVKVADHWTGGDKPNSNAIKEAAKDIGCFIFGLADELATKYSGVSPKAAGKFAEEKKLARKVNEPDWITLYQERVGKLRSLKERLQTEFGGSTVKLLILVDELDRCRPDYAVNYLETIKHIFDIPGMVFVLAIDRDQLESSARALYGDRMKFEEYFRKFRHREIPLPLRTRVANFNFIRHCTKKFLDPDGRRTSYLEVGPRLHEKLVDVIAGFHLQPRQIQEVFRLLGHLMATDHPSNVGRIKWTIEAASIVMCCLRVARPDQFKAYYLRSADPIDVCREVRKALGPKKAEWWLCVMLAGLWTGEESKPMLLSAIKEFELCDKTETNPFSVLSGSFNSWENFPDGLHDVATKIVEVDQF